MAAVASMLTLFRSREPFTYLALAGGFLVAALVLYGLIHVLGVIICLPVPHLIAASDYLPAAALLLIATTLLLWARGFRLTVTDDALVYTTLFHRPRAVRYSDIVECSLRVGYEPGESRMLPSIRLLIEHRSSPKPLVLNLKVFPREAIADLLNRTRPTS